MTKITAHAGCEKTPAGSLEYIRIAINANVDCIEVDLRLYNNTVYLSHDEIKSTDDLITFEQVIGMVRDTNIFLNCDVKENNACQKIIDELKKNNFTHRVVFTGSIDIDLVNSNNVGYLLNLEDSELISPPDFPRILELYKFHSKNKAFMGFNIDHTWFDEECLEFFNANNITLCLWTVDKHKSIDMFMNKVKYMTTNEILYALSKRACGSIPNYLTK